MHQRQRKAMNPAFSAQQLKLFVPLFQRVASEVSLPLSGNRFYGDDNAPSQLVAKWKAEIKEESGAVMSVDKWLARTTLDIIGKGERTPSKLYFEADLVLWLRSISNSAPWITPRTS